MWCVSVCSLLQSFLSRSRVGQAARRNPVASRLTLEALEDRTVPSFVPLTSYTGSTLQAVGDFNHDRRPDLVVTAGVRLANADGSFRAPLPIAGAGYAPAVGDFDRDG